MGDPCGMGSSCRIESSCNDSCWKGGRNCCKMDIRMTNRCMVCTAIGILIGWARVVGWAIGVWWL